MDTFRIVFIVLTFSFLVLGLYHFVKKLALKHQSKMNENDFVLIGQTIDNYVALIAELIFSALIISLNIVGKLNIVYNLILLVILILSSFAQIVNCRAKIIIKNEEVIITPSVGKTKRFTFTDIDTIKEFKSTKGVIIYTVYQSESEIFTFTDRHIGSTLFINKARKLRIKITNPEQ